MKTDSDSTSSTSRQRNGRERLVDQRSRNSSGHYMARGQKRVFFITTGRFSDEARSYVETIDRKVILIDYKALANYMMDFNLGVAKSFTYEIKRLDSDFFAEE